MIQNRSANTFRLNASRFIFFLLFTVLLILFLGLNPRLSLPIIFSFGVALIIRPIVPAIMKLGFPRAVARLIVLTFIGSIVAFPILTISPKINSESQKIQKYLPKIEKFIKENFYKIRISAKEKFSYDIPENLLENGLIIAEKKAQGWLLKVPTLLASILEWVFIVPLFVFFILRDGNGLKKGLLRLIPNPIFERVYYVLHEFNKKLGDYIFAKFVEASIVGFIIGTGLLVMDVKFSILLGFVAAITNIIPYVGPFIGMIPGIVVCLIESGQGAQLYGVIMLYTIANVIDLAIVFPLLVSKVVDLHPVVVVSSVILGSQYMGVIGMVVSIPLAAVFKLIFVEIFKGLYPILSKQNL